MNIIFKIMLFSIMLNAATGIMLHTIVDSDGNKVFDNTPGKNGGLFYNESYGTQAITGLEGTINPLPEATKSENFFYNLLDKVGLGFISKILTTMKDYLYGFLNVLQSIFGTWLGIDASRTIFGILRGLLTLGYTLGAIFLYMNKDSVNNEKW